MKKRRIQPSFASLTEAELEQLACDIQRETFAAVLERIRKPRSEGGLDLHFASKSPLERLLDKKNKLDLTNAHITSGRKLTLAEFNSITSGETRASEEVHDAIMGFTYDFVTSGENTPHQLLALQSLADFRARAELRAQTAAIHTERLQLQREKEQRAKELHAHKFEVDTFRKQMAIENLELKKQRLQLSQKLAEKTLSKNAPPPEKQEDQFGPYATNWDEVGERVRIAQGASKEEWARRLALHNPPQSNPNPNPNPNFSPSAYSEYSVVDPSQSAPSAQSAAHPSPSPNNQFPIINSQ